MVVALRVAKGCAPTAAVLKKLLKDNGVDTQGAKPKGTVCWGAGGVGGVSLNSACSRYNKLQQLEVLNKAGVQVVPFGLTIPPLGSNRFPLLARKLHHHGGKDILLCRTPLRCRKAKARGRAFFTQFIESSTEYRVWIYRQRHLGTYEKLLKHPELKLRAVGRNHRNGYAFELVSEDRIPRAAVDLAHASILALGLDFGAVDILYGKDKRFYVLEVNTAPGVEGEGRQVIKSLAHRIAKWAEAGFPARKV